MDKRIKLLALNVVILLSIISVNLSLLIAPVAKRFSGNLSFQAVSFYLNLFIIGFWGLWMVSPIVRDVSYYDEMFQNKAEILCAFNGFLSGLYLGNFYSGLMHILVGFTAGAAISLIFWSVSSVIVVEELNLQRILKQKYS